MISKKFVIMMTGCSDVRGKERPSTARTTATIKINQQKSVRNIVKVS